MRVNINTHTQLHLQKLRNPTFLWSTRWYEGHKPRAHRSWLKWCRRSLKTKSRLQKLPDVQVNQKPNCQRVDAQHEALCDISASIARHAIFPSTATVDGEVTVCAPGGARSQHSYTREQEPPLQPKHGGWLKSRLHASQHVAQHSTHVTCARSTSTKRRTCMITETDHEGRWSTTHPISP